MSELPSFIKINEDGSYSVTMKDGSIYKLEEQQYKKIKSIFNMQDQDILPVIYVSLLEPKKTELELLEEPASNIVRLTIAVTHMYDLKSFL